MATSPIYNWPEPDNTDLVKNGALAIRTLGNAIDTTMATMVPKSIVDAKGDLIAGTAADTAARLAVGNNGETLVADSSTATGLRYTSNFAAGKNKVINGDFSINQRSFTSTTADNTYTFDRWRTFRGGGGTSTYSTQTFTLGAAPVAGYEGKNFAQLVTASQSASSDYSLYIQLIESVRTFAGQTVTLSFWAKAGSGTPKIAGEMSQYFGTGGSPSSSVDTAAGAVTISTSWARYSMTVAVPSISGKTIGTNNNDYLGLYLWFSAGSDFNGRASSIGNQNNTFQIWGVQLEAGSTATAFQTATGTIQGELAACQRYYQIAGTIYGAANGTGVIEGLASTAVMRAIPTLAMLTSTPYAESPPSVTARNGSGSATALLNNSIGGGAMIRVTGFTGMTDLVPAWVGAGQISLSAEL